MTWVGRSARKLGDGLVPRKWKVLEILDRGHENYSENYKKSPGIKIKFFKLKIEEEARDKLECANENVRADLDRWNIEKKNDLKSILISFADQQIAHYEQCIRAWSEVVIQNPGGSKARSEAGVQNPSGSRASSNKSGSNS